MYILDIRDNVDLMDMPDIVEITAIPLMIINLVLLLFRVQFPTILGADKI